MGIGTQVRHYEAMEAPEMARKTLMSAWEIALSPSPEWTEHRRRRGEQFARAILRRLLVVGGYRVGGKS